VDPNIVVTNAAARPGDRLILTKPLGTGVMAFAAQIGRAPEGAPEAAARSMAALNRRASEVMIEFAAHACTDVTGFGLIGHLAAMASASGVDVEVVCDDVPPLPGVLQCAADGIFSGAVERNRESSGQCVEPDEDVEVAALDLLFDPQTSGGLLIAVAEPDAARMLERLHDQRVSEAAIIGSVLAAGSGRVFVRSDGRRRLPPPRQAARAAVATAAVDQSSEECCASQEASGMSCCEDGNPSDTHAASGGGATDAQQKFREFLKSAGAPGALDAYTKQAVAVALSVLAKCEPCVKAHVKKARDMGFSQEEIDEAAWMAISFGGSPTMMFYNTLKTS
jgi:AhpD family alkylhydroperoxidase